MTHFSTLRPRKRMQPQKWQKKKTFSVKFLTKGGGGGMGKAAVAEWLSSWLAEQEVRGSIPRLATQISEIRYLLASKSRYGWNTAKSDVNPQYNQLTKGCNHCIPCKSTNGHLSG